ncbi:MAG: Tim44 domain-containing protein, partial [Burkholderiales bacterium]
MKRSFLMAAMLVLGAVVLAAPAEAKRLGGGKSVGAQRETVTQRQATPPATGAPQAGA